MIVSRWGLPSPSAQRGLAAWPTDFSRDIKPIPCHSHNDYWRHVPLYDALAAGCTGVEADVWSSSKLEDDLYVGHDHNSLKSERTLKSLYIDPLLTILNNQNKPSPLFSPNQTSLLPSSIDPKVGIFDTSPSTSLTLLIDLKTAADTTFPIVLAALQPLLQANYLTTYSTTTGIIPGPITVVATGNTKFTANILSPANTDPIRSIFFDAPLPALSDPNPSAEDLFYSTDNSYYASVSFSKAISRDHFMQMTDKQIEKVRKQIQAAKAKGL
ncbi:MAG: hypothetical protein Q9188_004115, partial [Gyalolechia gomerana]